MKYELLITTFALFLMKFCIGLINLADVECGQQSVIFHPNIRILHGRVAGGRSALHGEYPWIVSLQANGKHFCGGFLVNRSIVISAAHCFNGLSHDTVKRVVRVHVGEHTLGEAETPIDSKSIRISNINVHHEYDSSKRTMNDIALVYLANEVEWNTYVQPACLSNVSEDIKVGTQAKVAGWGINQESTETSGTLMTVELDIISHADCKREHEWNPSPKQFCTGDPNKERGGCKGDSGSPIMVKSNSENALSVIGIHVGSGSVCGALPGICTKISSYIDWIIDPSK